MKEVIHTAEACPQKTVINHRLYEEIKAVAREKVIQKLTGWSNLHKSEVRMRIYSVKFFDLCCCIFFRLFLCSSYLRSLGNAKSRINGPGWNP